MPTNTIAPVSVPTSVPTSMTTATLASDRVLREALADLAEQVMPTTSTWGMTDEQVSVLVSVLIAAGHPQAATAVCAHDQLGEALAQLSGPELEAAAEEIWNQVADLTAQLGLNEHTTAAGRRIALVETLDWLDDQATAAPTMADGMTEDQASALVTVLVAAGYSESAEALTASRRDHSRREQSARRRPRARVAR